MSEQIVTAAPTDVAAPAVAPSTTTTTASDARANLGRTVVVTQPASDASVTSGTEAGQMPAVENAPAPTVKEDATGRLHGPDGKFAPKTEEVTGASEVAPERGAESKPAAAAEVPEGFVKIDLPEGHPLRDRGRDYIVAPADMEVDYRGLVGANARRAEVEAATQRAAQLEEHALRLQAVVEARTESLMEALRDPTLAQRMAEVREVWGEEAAQDFLNGVLSRQDGKIRERFDALGQQLQEQRLQQTATSFISQVQEQAPKAFPHWSHGEIERALMAFASYCEANDAPGATLEEFVEFASPMYVRHPKVQEEVKTYLSRQDEARLQKEQELKEQQARLLNNPMGRLPAALNTGRTLPVDVPRAANAADARKNLGRSYAGAP